MPRKTILGCAVLLAAVSTGWRPAQANDNPSMRTPEALREPLGRGEHISLPSRPQTEDPPAVKPAKPALSRDYLELSKPLSTRGKFVMSLKDTFYPVPLFFSCVSAGISQARNSKYDRQWGQGALGFGGRFIDDVGASFGQEFFGTFLLASALHQDPRYHPSPRKGAAHRFLYALSRVFITQTDSGGRAFNWSNLGGIAASAALENAWIHGPGRSTSQTGIRFGMGVGMGGAWALFEEFIHFRKAPRQ